MAAFDVDPDLVRRLAALLEETGLTEIEYQEGRRRIRVGRGAQGQTVVTPAPMPTTADGAASKTPAPDHPAEPVHPGAVTAPMVGTAYLQPEPGSPHFVQEGDQVRQGDTLLIVEAMKVMNQILAPRAGTVSQILVSNGAPVEYGEALIILE